MFAGLLHKGFRGSLPLLLIFLLCCAVLTYFAPVAIEMEYYPNLFYNYFTLSIENKLMVVVLNYLFIGTGLILISYIAVNQEVTEKLNYFPVFLFLLINVVSVNAFQVNSQVFSNIFILFSIYKLLSIYRRDNALQDIFGASFWLCCSAFITTASIISFPLFFIVLMILRPFYWREWVVALLGFLTPVLLYECVAYLTDFNQWYLFQSTESFFQYMKVPSFSEYYLPLGFSLFLLLIIAIVNSIASGFGNTVKKQKARIILLWYIFFALFGFFSGGANSSVIILTYALPLSLFIGDFLFGLKRIKITNTILVLLLCCVLIIYAGRYNLI